MTILSTKIELINYSEEAIDTVVGWCLLWMRTERAIHQIKRSKQTTSVCMATWALNEFDRWNFVCGARRPLIQTASPNIHTTRRNTMWKIVSVLRNNIRIKSSQWDSDNVKKFKFEWAAFCVCELWISLIHEYVCARPKTCSASYYSFVQLAFRWVSDICCVVATASTHLSYSIMIQIKQFDFIFFPFSIYCRH